MKTYHSRYDIIVIGGGHAGIEAAHIAAKLGAKTLLITLNIDRIGHMPCNPALGGIGKGHIVFEIAALGGLMPQLARQTYLQARMLNTSKGPAVHGLRVQIDKHEYRRLSRYMLEMTPNLTIVNGMAQEILVNDSNQVEGVRTREGFDYQATAVVVTTGTFLNGLVHIGQSTYQAGRQGEEASVNLSASLKAMGLQMGRLKTGTPPRLISTTLDFSKMEKQESDPLEYLFEFYPHRVEHKIPCYVTATNERTHEVIKSFAHLSPIYTGKITGIPPRYCPSIEDKISRFPSKNEHHVFVEPEAAMSKEIYPNGLSTSLPLYAQQEFIRTISGFENAEIARPGYAIEYDFVFPNQLKHTLETNAIAGLFCAGQINGTTGYEEAAGQGIIAGINAHGYAFGHEPFIIDRNEGYIGIMIDDLVTLGVDEPYRMFTSRAERRLMLRQDNTFIRYAEKSFKRGLISQQLYDDIRLEHDLVMLLTQRLQELHGIELTRLLSKGETQTVMNMIDHITPETKLSERVKVAIHAALLYEPYLKREEREAEKSRHFQSLFIPATFDYKGVPGLSIELQQKLTKYQPKTIAQAALIQGMTPAALSILIFRTRQLYQTTMHEGE